MIGRKALFLIAKWNLKYLYIFTPTIKSIVVGEKLKIKPFDQS